MKKVKIAIIGATGVLGHQMVNLIDSEFPKEKYDIELIAVASKKSIGREVSFGERSVLKIIPLESFISENQGKASEVFDFVINTTPKTVAQKWHDDLVQMTRHYIDLSYHSNLLAESVLLSGFKKKREDIDSKATIFAVPHCVSLAFERICTVLENNEVKPTRAVMNAMLAASENGKSAMDELYDQAKKTFVHQSLKVQHYNKQIAFNLLPIHGEMMSDGQIFSEWLVRGEAQKMGYKSVPLSLRVIQAPVFIGSSMSLHLEFEDEVIADDLKKHMTLENGLILMDRHDSENAATPIDCAGEPNFVVSRIAEDWSSENAIHFWLCGDNLSIRTKLVSDFIRQTL